MKKMLKKTLAVFLCVWMLCLTGVAASAASEQPYETPLSIKLNKASLSMAYGGTAQLTATVEPAGADQKVTWSSSNTNLIVVDGTGKLTAAAATDDTPSEKQTVVITVSSVSTPSVKATCTVTLGKDNTAVIIASVISLLQTVFVAMVGALADPTKQLFSVVIDLFNQLLKQA